jgi:ABC-2 type transport system permease protein
MRASVLFGGVFYPVSIFPGWVKKLAFFIPLTHCLEGMRMTLLKGASFYDVRVSILFLLVFSILTVPISLAVFKFAVKKAKMEGSLIKY